MNPIPSNLNLKYPSYLSIQSIHDATQKQQEAKAKMDEEFSRNRKVRGDDGFVYDVQKDFNPTEANEWDSSDEEGEGDDVGPQ
jgi:hypothetical protein